MSKVTQLGYLVLSVSDLAAWETFATQTLGLQTNGSTGDGALFLRMDEYHHRFILAPGPKDDLSAIGWEVENETALAALAQRLRDNDVEVTPGTAQEKEERRVVDLIRFSDPNGMTVEAYAGPLVSIEAPFRSGRPIQGFVASRQGLGHITIAVDDLEQTLHFYRDLLGMRLSDWVQPQPKRAVESRFNIAFLHCNPRHHSLAFWQGKRGKRLHHFMLQLSSVEDVASTYDLCHERGVPIEMSLGRHTNDRMLSFYVRSPSGFSVEYGWGAREVDDSDWQVQLHRTGSTWGHRLVGH